MMKWRGISTYLFLFLTTVLPIINGYVIANEHQHLKGFKAIECGDGSSCLVDQTCCPDGAGGYGCCPTPDATCCEDHIRFVLLIIQYVMSIQVLVEIVKVSIKLLFEKI